VVHGAQKNLTTNSIVKLRLLDPLTINGVVVPKNSFVYGRVSFSDSRMQITVDNINYRDNVLPFRGQIYDKDGFRGIYVPDNAIADAGKEGKSSTVDDQNTDFSTRHASTSLVGVGVTAVNSLGRAAKKAISKSASKTRVNIAANYLITIREVE
jgi:conjugative transposon TraM protein